jgi:hypothetical protein
MGIDCGSELHITARLIFLNPMKPLERLPAERPGNYL